MDNFSPEPEEKDLENQNLDPENISDIQFEEVEKPQEKFEETSTDIQEKASDEASEPTEQIEPTEDILQDVVFEEPVQETTQSGADDSEISDEELTKKLQEQFLNISSEEPSALVQTETSEIQPITEPDKNAKKYVIYIDSENIEFIENLSINDRREIINKILKEQDEIIKTRKKAEERVRFTKHAILAGLTFIICFPILFFLVNKSLEVTITNYQRSRENFVKLYKEQGKIKPSEKNVIGD